MCLQMRNLILTFIFLIIQLGALLWYGTLSRILGKKKIDTQ